MSKSRHKVKKSSRNSECEENQLMFTSQFFHSENEEVGGRDDDDTEGWNKWSVQDTRTHTHTHNHPQSPR